MIRQVDLISPAYKQTQVDLHARAIGYGQKGSTWAPSVRWLLEHTGSTSVLDYGCGQGSLGQALRQYGIPGLRIAEYDPAIVGKDYPPSFADLVVSTDVLEHVEPDRIATVLTHLRRLARRAVFVVVSLRPASKVLSDGRNAHLIQESVEWWSRQCEAAGLTVQPVSAEMPMPSKGAARCWVAVLTP